MTDRRFDFSNARVKTPWRDGPATAEVRTPTDHVVRVTVLDILDAPGGKRDRQVLYNDSVEVLEVHKGHAFLRAGEALGYVGYADATALAPKPEHPIPDAWIAVRASHAYEDPDIKSPERISLSMGTQLSPLKAENGLVETEAGWVPEVHLAWVPESDPVAVAERLLGTPYLWGGNSAFGIDCSGLVWLAYIFCGEALMPDSDLQKAHNGEPIEDGSIHRGDLWFWDGHVAMVVDATRLIHANAHHMAVVHEDMAKALHRIGPTTARKRIVLPCV